MDITLRPLTALLFRDGRPYSGAAGARSLQLPPSTTLRGALRTGIASRRGVLGSLVDGAQGSVDDVVGGRSDPGRLRLRGPLVAAEIDGVDHLLAPPPVDLVLLRPQDGSGRSAQARLAGVGVEDGDGTFDLRQVTVEPTSLDGDVTAKANPSPSLVTMSFLQRWLACGSGDPLPAPPAELGVLARRTDTHVVVGEFRRHEEGGLYQSERIEFDPSRQGRLWLRLDDGLADEDVLGDVTVGGDAGVALVERSTASCSSWLPAKLPPQIASAIERSAGLLRVVHLTHCVATDWHPLSPADCGHLDLPPSQLEIALLPGHTPVSGVALGKGGSRQARRARRAIPAGATFVYRFDDQRTALDAAAKLWANQVGSDQARLEGFGLVVCGGWPFKTERGGPRLGTREERQR